MDAAFTMVEGNSEEVGHSSSRPTCPRCSQPVYKVHRRWPDRLVSVFHSVRRYRCRTERCGWQGLRSRSQPSASLWESAARAPATWIMVGVLAVPLIVLLARVYLSHGGAQPAQFSSQSGQLAPLQEAPGESGAGNVLDADDLRRKVKSSLGEPRQGCVWGGPGQRPYDGTLADALIAAQLPMEVVGKLAILRERGVVSDRLEISSNGIQSADRRRQFGSTMKAMALDGTICFNTRMNLRSETKVAADMYELIDGTDQHYSIMVVEQGGNVAVLEERSGR